MNEQHALDMMKKLRESMLLTEDGVCSSLPYDASYVIEDALASRYRMIDRLDESERVMKRAAEIIDRNLNRQNEKVDDAKLLLLNFLSREN